MPLALVIGDIGSHSGEPVVSGSTRTFIAGSGAAHIGSDIAGHPLGSAYHGGPTIVGSATANRTIVAGTPLAGSGATGSCGDSISAITTTRTYVS